MSKTSLITLLHLLKRPLIPFAALIATMPAVAQENKKFKVIFGVQASATMPESKLDPAKRYPPKIGITNGKGGGAFVEFIWLNKFALRAQHDYIGWDGYEYKYSFLPDFYTSGSISSRHDMKILDFIYYNNVKYLPYFFSGIGFGKKYHTIETPYRDRDVDDFAELHLGAGYNLIGPLGLEIKYVMTGGNWFQASVLLRF